MADWDWHDLSKGKSIEYTCAYCGREVAVSNGWISIRKIERTERSRYIRICHHCSHATYFDDSRQQYPAPSFGEPIQKIVDDVGRLYDEARRAFSVNSFTAVVLCCRVLLMHIAVDHEAETGKTFAYYVDYLRDNNIVPQRAKAWVDSIRGVGNIANHKIILIDKDKAESTLRFTEMLLKLAYEYPSIGEDLTTK